MIFAVKIPFSYVKAFAPPLFSEIRRTDWMPTPLPFLFEDWKTPFFSRTSPSLLEPVSEEKLKEGLSVWLEKRKTKKAGTHKKQI